MMRDFWRDLVRLAVHHWRRRHPRPEAPPPPAEDEIKTMIDVASQRGLIDKSLDDMLGGVLSLKDRRVAEVMVPRPDMTVVPVTAPVAEAVRIIVATGHSRIPVYTDVMDNIAGVVYAKDLLRSWGRDDPGVTVASVMRPPFIVPETKGLRELLREFQQRRNHLAVVINEYGGTAGLVTIEDVLEEIVGEIRDEHEPSGDEPRVREVAPGPYVVDGRVAVEEVEDLFDVVLPRDGFETIGGLVMHLTGRIPGPGDAVPCQGLHLTVESATARRVHRVRIERAVPAVADSPVPTKASETGSP